MAYVVFSVRYEPKPKKYVTDDLNVINKHHRV